LGNGGEQNHAAADFTTTGGDFEYVIGWRETRAGLRHDLDTFYG
jgi:hypothetical protein